MCLGLMGKNSYICTKSYNRFITHVSTMRRFINFVLFSVLVSLTVTEASSAVNLRPFRAGAVRETDSIAWTRYVPRSCPVPRQEILIESDSVVLHKSEPLPAGKYGPVVYKDYAFVDKVELFPEVKDAQTPFLSAYRWLEDYDSSNDLLNEVRRTYEIGYPSSVIYNSNNMPEVPKEYRAYVDKVTSRIVFEEMKVDESGLTSVKQDIARKNWIHSFDASIQFSQAYISPNWYQGGKNNLNVIGQLLYNVKLNQKFYPNLLFDTTVSYKLALNSAPDDSIHAFNISEDIFQVNSTFGLKAARNWYYSANLLFKTQLFNSYPSNSRTLQSAFLSPGELNVGIGMTYNYKNKKETVKFGTSISPLSWNMKTCINRRIDETGYGIEAGRHTTNKVGSSAECTLEWKVAYNIMYHSRLFLFTDYNYAYTDWEHTIDLSINRFLSTRLYVNMRYDTSTPKLPDTKWSKFQLKEIFSFGFAYHFGSI